MWQDELATAQERLRSLDRDAVIEQRIADVVSWRSVPSASTFFHPLPQLLRGHFDITGWWLAPSTEPHPWTNCVGLDGEERPIISIRAPRPDPSMAMSIWTYEASGSFVQINGHVITLACTERGHIARLVSASADGTLEVRLLQREGERAMRAEGAVVRSALGITATVAQARYDVGDRIERVMTRAEIVPPSPGAEPLAVQLLAAGLDHARTLVVTEANTMWDGRARGWEPWPADPAALVTGLSQALAAAVRQTLPPVPDPPCVIDIQFNEEPQGPPLPPRAKVACRPHFEGARRRGETVFEAVHVGWSGADPGAHELPIIDHLDAQSLQWCRAISCALHVHSPNRDAAYEAVTALGDRLAQLLADVFDDDAAALVLVYLNDGNQDPLHHAFERAQQTRGAAAVSGLLEYYD
jgi:hypothetical protein